MGQFYEKNKDKIIRLIEKKEGSKLRAVAEEGARLGDAECVELIGEDYYYGRSTTTDYSKAFYYFSKAAEGDSRTAWYHLGLSYWFAEGVKRDAAKGLECVRKAMSYYRPADYFGFAMAACASKEKGDSAMVAKLMKALYDCVYKENDYAIAGFAYAVYLIQGEAFPDAFDPCAPGVPAENKREGMRILEEISKNGKDRGYADYYLSLIYALGMPPVSANSKKAYQYLKMSANSECFPAAHTKSEMFKGKRDTKVIYFFKGGEIACGNLYGKVDDAIDKLGLMVANSHVHEFDRDMMMLHGYAQFEVDMDARITAVYGRDPKAVILTKGPTMRKYVNGTPQPVYEAPVFDPQSPVTVDASPAGRASAPAPQKSSAVSSIIGAAKDATKNVDLNAAANAAGDAVNKAADKVKGLFGKFKK